MLANEVHLRTIEKEYIGRKNELHDGLVSQVRKTLGDLGEMSLDLDSRVEKALLTIPRHKFLRYSGTYESWTLDLAYSNSIVTLDWLETFSRMQETLVNNYGIQIEKLENLQVEDLEILMSIFFKPNVSTASEPAIVAHMTQLVLPDDMSVKSEWRALEIGSGGGYQVAILNQVGFTQVYGVEIKEYLVNHSRHALESYEGSEIIHGDGSKGLPDKAPFDAIIVAAAVEDKSVTQTLLSQLTDSGVLVIPERFSESILSQFSLKPEVREISGHTFSYTDEPKCLSQYRGTIDDKGRQGFEKSYEGTVGFVRLRVQSED